MKKKIILTGNFGVGKSSMFRRFVKGVFEDKYLTTIGIKIDQKEITVNEETVTLMIWDLAGEITQDKVPTNYFRDTSGIIYIFDLTRPLTYENLLIDIEYLKKTLTPFPPLFVVGNKSDLLDNDEKQAILNQLPVECNFITSAKTGENVETLLEKIAVAVL